MVYHRMSFATYIYYIGPIAIIAFSPCAARHLCALVHTSFGLIIIIIIIIITEILFLQYLAANYGIFLVISDKQLPKSNKHNIQLSHILLTL